MTGDLTFEVLDWAWINRPLIDGTDGRRPHPDDVRCAEAEGLLCRRDDRWDLTVDGELVWASQQGCMAGVR